MATISNVVDDGDLVTYRPKLKAREHRQRSIYISQSLKVWFDEDLPNVPCERGHRVSPNAYTHSLLKRFITGERFVLTDEYKKLDVRQPVWTFRPQGVRVFGYFYKRAVFIGVTGALRCELDPKGFKDKKEEVIEFIKKINLDPPPCITSELPKDVL